MTQQTGKDRYAGTTPEGGGKQDAPDTSDAPDESQRGYGGAGKEREKKLDDADE